MAKKKSKADASPDAVAPGRLRVKMLSDLAGTGFVFVRGEEVDIEAGEAGRWIEAGFAESVED